MDPKPIADLTRLTVVCGSDRGANIIQTQITVRGIRERMRDSGTD